MIYIDPYVGDGYDLPADLLLVTHSHYDHNDLDKVENRNTSGNVYVYVNARGNPSNPSNMGTMINDLYQSAGLSEEITGAHILRHTFATDLYYQGAPIKIIASYIGDQESTTERYYIAIRRTIRAGNRVLNVVPLPEAKHNK